MFVTADEYKNYWGEDLRDRMRGNDNISNQAESFLERVEDRLMSWIDSNTFRNVKYENLTEYQLGMFKKAILNQAKYTLMNGDIGLDSGYDMEEGMKMRQSDLNALEVCRPALSYLKNAGLFNLNVQNRPRFSNSSGTLGIEEFR